MIKSCFNYLDGLRWQELFAGADPLIIKNENFVKHPEDFMTVLENKQEKRRSLLMPFVWNEIVKIGQIFEIEI